MDNIQKSFDAMQDKILTLVELLNNRHKAGIGYGTGDRISPAEAHTIRAIGENQGINLTGLAKLMNVTKATMSERLKKLEKIGLIKKSKTLHNRKEIIITLTETGREILRGHEKAHHEMCGFFTSYFGSDTERQLELFNRAFADYLAVIRASSSRKTGD